MIFDEPQHTFYANPRLRSGRLPGGVAGNQHSARQLNGRHRLRKSEGINLKAVAAALADEDFDLTSEIVRALKDGRIDDEETRVRLMLSLLEYVQPRLKSVEVTQDKPFEAVIRWAE